MAKKCSRLGSRSQATVSEVGLSPGRWRRGRIPCRALPRAPRPAGAFSARRPASRSRARSPLTPPPARDLPISARGGHRSTAGPVVAGGDSMSALPRAPRPAGAFSARRPVSRSWARSPLTPPPARDLPISARGGHRSTAGPVAAGADTMPSPASGPQTGGRL